MSLNATSLFIQSSPLPATFRGSPNDLFAEMIKRMRIVSPTGTNFIYVGDTEPTSNVGPWLKGGTQWYVWDEDVNRYVPVDISPSFTPAFFIGRSQPATTNPTVWLQTTKDATTSNPLDYGEMLRWFQWNGSLWVSPHPVPPSSSECRLWRGTEAELWAYDGGDGTNPGINAPTETTGAMWQVDAAFAFRFPVGVGTNPTTFDGNPASSIAPGETGGQERLNLATNEMPRHRHHCFVEEVTGASDVTGDQHSQSHGSYGSDVDYNLGQAANQATEPNTVLTDYIGGDSTPGQGVSHENMPPFLGVYFICRTARKFYTP